MYEKELEDEKEAKKAINALASKALIHKIKAAVYSFYTDKRGNAKSKAG